MSGPVLLDVTGGAIGGNVINQAAIPINGFSGAMGLFIEMLDDEQMFELYISGRLNSKEKVCAIRRTPKLKAPRTAKLVPVCRKVKP